jgi:hypothetical protein
VRVLIVHGLGRTPVSCLRLARTLRRSGCLVESFPYVAFAQAYGRIVDRLVARLELLAAAGEYAVVGHSLGGILLRDALARLSCAPPRHLVMIGTPNRSPRAARIAVRFPPFRWFAGECGACLASPAFYRTLPRPAVPYTVIAGTRGLGGRWSPFAGEPNDGLVAVDEARLGDGEEVLTFPVAHTFMMNDARVQQAVRAALGVASR